MKSIQALADSLGFGNVRPGELGHSGEEARIEEYASKGGAGSSRISIYGIEVVERVIKNTHEMPLCIYASAYLPAKEVWGLRHIYHLTHRDLVWSLIYNIPSFPGPHPVQYVAH